MNYKNCSDKGELSNVKFTNSEEAANLYKVCIKERISRALWNFEAL
jgi:hypothetical protein